MSQLHPGILVELFSHACASSPRQSSRRSPTRVGSARAPALPVRSGPRGKREGAPRELDHNQAARCDPTTGKAARGDRQAPGSAGRRRDRANGNRRLAAADSVPPASAALPAAGGIIRRPTRSRRLSQIAKIRRVLEYEVRRASSATRKATWTVVARTDHVHRSRRSRYSPASKCTEGGRPLAQDRRASVSQGSPSV